MEWVLSRLLPCQHWRVWNVWPRLDSKAPRRAACCAGRSTTKSPSPPTPLVPLLKPKGSLGSGCWKSPEHLTSIAVWVLRSPWCCLQKPTKTTHGHRHHRLKYLRKSYKTSKSLHRTIKMMVYHCPCVTIHGPTRSRQGTANAKDVVQKFLIGSVGLNMEGGQPFARLFQ